MKASIKVSGTITVIELVGKIDLESTEAFDHVCTSHLIGKKIIFNFENLGFVGSTGIKPFCETIQKLNQSGGLKLVAMSDDFKKVIPSIISENLQIFDNEELAMLSFQD